MRASTVTRTDDRAGGFPGGSDYQSSDVLLANADAAAYRAKRLGGNRVCVFDGDLDSVISRHQQNAEGALKCDDAAVRSL